MESPQTTTKCVWPGCEENIQGQVMLQIAKEDPHLPGQIDPESISPRKKEGLAMNAGACVYHTLILGSRRFCALEDQNKKDHFKLHGPFMQVDLIESVIAAREVTKMNQPKTQAEVKELAKNKKK